jgi:hypothetical protein
MQFHSLKNLRGNMKWIAMGCLCAAWALPALAQSVNAPTFKAGDTWTYKITTEKGNAGWTQNHEVSTVSRATPSSIYFQTKQEGSTQPPRELVSGIDWSRMRDVNGKETVVNRPLSFPLTVGKTWELDYTEQQPNKAHKAETFHNKYTVIGYESIQVPAGTFNALKIEAEGRWDAEIAPSQSAVATTQATQNGTVAVAQVSKTLATTATGRTYKAFWYVPEIKRFVRTEEEYYNNGGVRNERYTSELESFTLNTQ